MNSSKIISRTLARLATANGNNDIVIQTTVEIDSEVSECEAYLRAMDVESKSMSASDKAEGRKKTQEYREDYKDTVKNYQAARREALAVVNKQGTTGRNKLIQQGSRLDRSTDILMSSKSLVANSEEIGGKILSDLENQKEVLLDADMKVQGTKGIAEDARDILKMMGARAFWHKCCIYTWIISLFVVICVLIFYGFINPNIKHDK